MIKPKKSVENMTGYFVPMFEDNWSIKLDSNENNYGPSPFVLEAIRNCTQKEISFYPFYGKLTDEIATFYGFKPENIKVTNGADEAILGIIQTYMDAGDYLLTLDVTFDMPAIYATIQGAKIKRIPFEKKWEFPTDTFLNSINKEVKLIYIATPNNPTGNTIKEADIIKIIEKAKDKIVIIDETYANYCNKSNKDLVNKYDNVFIVKSFSKDFALAGMRLGFIISHEQNINNIKKVVSPYSVNALVQEAGIAALKDVEYFNKLREEIKESKAELKEFFTNIGMEVYDSEANFLLINCKAKANFIYEKLKQNSIAIKLFKKNSILENHVRITIPTKKGVSEIKKALTIKPYLVFDMDGVLVDASNSYRLAIAKTFEFFAKKTITAEEIQNAKNRGGLNNDWDLTDFLLKQNNIKTEYKSLVEEFQKIYWNDGLGLINNENALFSIKLFRELSENYNLAIFTGRLRKEAEFALNKFDADNLFYPIITADDIPKDKGKPDAYGLKLIKEITFGNEYYYFGDTIDDIASAKNADYIPIGVLPPQDKSKILENNLKEKGAKYILKEINEIENTLEKYNERMC